MYHFNANSNVKIVDTSLVNKILEQGQKLRNAMVGSILKNDPFNTDIIYNKHFNTPKTSSSDLINNKNVNLLNSIDEKRVEAYIKGEDMTKGEEKLALDTLRSMSAPDLCKTTERTLNSTCLSTCKCYICEIYNSNNLYCDLKRKNKEVEDSTKPYSSSEITKDIQEKYKTENKNLLKYVDSLKVVINKIMLNETGNRKVSDNDRVPYNFSQTYFLEYCLPECIINKSITSKSKVNSGLENNFVRFCSRRSNDLINFKQIMIHDIKNLDQCNLDDCEIKFKISFRTQRQKNASTLGFVKFNLGSLLLSKNLVGNRNLPIFLNEHSPINVGHLKISLSLGCGRLYFGQEFIDAINSVNGNAIVLDSDDSTNQLNRKEYNYNISQNEFLPKDNLNKYTYKSKNIVEENEQAHTENVPKKVITHDKKQVVKESFCKPVVVKRTKPTGQAEKLPQTSITENINEGVNNKSEHKINETETYSDSTYKRALKSQINENEKQILFGFLYISEVQYLSSAINTYITCRPFGQNETSSSKLVTDTSNPIFNFSQLVPLLYEDELLQLLRENYMLIEFWKKVETTDLVIGLTKIPFHQFYLAYRNPVFVKYLSKNKLPIIDTDWWEPIYSVDTENIIGQVQILVALGTEDQINNLKAERGFTENTVKAKFAHFQSNFKYEKQIVEKPNYVNRFTQERNIRDLLGLKDRNSGRINLNKLENIRRQSPYSELEEKNRNNFTDKAVNTVLPPKRPFTPPIQKFDVGIQSTLEMDKMPNTQDKDKISPTQEMLGDFLNQLMTERQKNIFVENSTNTEALETGRSNCSQSLQNAQNDTNLKLRKTTDLLDSLQKALSLDSSPGIQVKEKKPGTFRASIEINSANHLPSRKKCKSRKSRSRSIKNEDNVLPSCYVTFEISENDLKFTPVVVKTTNPTWNFKYEGNLSVDLLTNSQRRLIFKVWRKATNAVLSPNMQTDVVLGFAAVDLTVLLAGFPNVKGWFNIIDFTGKCNGQINIHITPLEDLSRYTPRKEECNCNTSTENVETKILKQEDEPSEVFSRALKRKFTELDEITQRLRLRLSKVTNDDSDSSSDGIAEEFEKDINTLCIEEDFDLIDFDEETKKINSNYCKENAMESEGSTSKSQTLLTIKERDCNPKDDERVFIGDENKTSSSNTATSLTQNTGSLLGLSSNSEREKELSTLDKHLQEGKQKIDTLLEKLSLISADTNNTFASRYVSGCSLNNDYNAINIDTEAILKELDHSSRPNIQSSLGFEPLKFQQLYGGSCDGNSSKNSDASVSHTSNSDTSLITNFSDSRPAPDGQGNVLDDKVVKK